MTFRALATAALAGFLVTAARADDKDAADLKKFAGTWELVGAAKNGESVSREEREAFRLVVKGGAYEYRVNGKATEKGKIAFTGRQKEFVFIDLTPADGANKGKVFKGLFEWIEDGDSARVTLPDKPLPGRLIKAGSEKDSGQSLYLYKRAKG